MASVSVSHGVDINNRNLFGAVLAWHVAQLIYSAYARCSLLSQEQEQHTCKKYGAPVYTNTIYKDEYGWKVSCVLTYTKFVSIKMCVLEESP